MAFTDTFIKKPVLSLAITIAILLVGFICFTRMPVREYPVVNLPVVTIKTVYPGANPRVMAGFVTQPIQQAISGVDGIDYMTAQNTQNNSIIVVWLHVGTNIDHALTQINSDISSIRWKLPKNINDPEIKLGGMGAPVMFLDAGSDTASDANVADYMNRNLVPRIQGLPGVQGVMIYAANYAMRLWLDPVKMHAQDISAGDVMKAVQAQNVQAPLGKLENSQEEYDLLSNSGLTKASQFNNLVLRRDSNGHLVRLKDVGHAALGEQASDIDGRTGFFKNSVILGVLPQNTANSIQLSKQIRAMLPDLRKKLPPGIGIKILWDTSLFSIHSIHLVVETIWLAILCVMIVIFCFLGSVRALVTPVVTIPLSLIGTSMFMFAAGFSFNTFTLLAWVLAIGLVVDDSIVVLENIHRHIEMGKERFQAAMDATREIFVPIVAMTLVVAVVFIPIAFTSGIISPLFQEFGLTLSITVILSGFFALILTPLMCAHLFKDTLHQSKIVTLIDRVFERIESGYHYLLNGVFKVRPLVIVCVIGVLAACAFIFTQLHSELIPDEDQGVALGIGQAPTSASKAYLAKTSGELANIVKKQPELQSYGVVTGFTGRTSVISFLILRPHQPGDRTEDQILGDLNMQFSKVPGLKLFAMNRPALADVTGFSAPVQFVVQTTGNYNQLYDVVQKMLKKLSQNPNLLNVTTDLLINKPDYNVQINRSRAAVLGVPVTSITSSLGMLLGEPTIGWFDMTGWSYPIIPRLLPKYYQLPNNLNILTVRSDSGKMVPLSNLVTTQEETVPASLNQFQQLRSDTISANLAHGYSQGQAISYLESVAKQVLPNDMKYDFAGTTREFVQESGQEIMIFLSALMAIYLLLTIKFDSFMDPLIVMISVPLSTLGALFAIYVSGFTLNIYTKIGLVMLIGLISKHGILIVNFANHLQKSEKYDVRTAVLEAAKIRLRPILMTTCAMVFGSIPLAAASGQGHEALTQIGIVLIGGLSFGSLLTLFVVPTFYTLLAKKFN
jgi:multidrug efflux pump